jgi:hypothetical protein
MIRELIRRCPFCGREATVSAQEYAENPYCNKCFDERVKQTARDLGNFSCRLSGDLFEIIPESKTAL